MEEFIVNNWKWIIATTIAGLGLLVSYLAYRRSSFSKTIQKGGKNSINIQSSQNVKVSKNE